MAKVLIASLGESPVVVPVMYHLLKGMGINFDEVRVLVPKGGLVPLSYDLVEEALKAKCRLEMVQLDFEDANTQQDCLRFLQKLAQELNRQQQEQNEVYLSLAGGRKSMAALMAWVVPFFPNIKGLFHVLDPDEEQFPSIDEIVDYSLARRRTLMRPQKDDLEKLKLISIPYKQQQVDNEIIAHLQTVGEEELEELPDDEAAMITMVQEVTGGEESLDVQITQMAKEQYEDLCKKDANRARSLRTQYFPKMRTATGIRALFHSTDDIQDKSAPGILHQDKSMKMVVRPLFYTTPNTLHTHPRRQEKLTEVVVCALETKDNKGDYRTLSQIKSDPKFSWKPVGSIDKLPQMSEEVGEKHVLLVPLGTHPMIATQLYTLLTKSEGLSIQEIVLFYPQLSIPIHDGIELLDRVVREEKRRTGNTILLRGVQIENRGDIDSEDACKEYQQRLEKEIENIRSSSPDTKILLSLSGGRKGMTAMTIFAAQNMGLPYVYHTLIADEKLSERIEKETTIRELNNPSKMTKAERNDKLFLRSYDRSKFHLFPVPVLTREQLTGN